MTKIQKHRNNNHGMLCSGEDLLPNGDLNKSNHFEHRPFMSYMPSRLTMSESYDQQVNHVRIIDRQVNDARIIGPELKRWDSSCSLVSSVCSVVLQRRQPEYLIDASEDLCSVWLHEGAGCHGLVGPRHCSSSSVGEKKLLLPPCWFDSVDPLV